MSIEARITYWLSEDGRRDSLRAGGTGQKVQVQVGAIRPEDIDGFRVDEQGRISLDASSLSEPVKAVISRWSSRGLVNLIVSSRDNWRIEWNCVPQWEHLLDFARFNRDVTREHDEAQEEAIEASYMEEKAILDAF